MDRLTPTTVAAVPLRSVGVNRGVGSSLHRSRVSPTSPGRRSRRRASGERVRRRAEWSRPAAAWDGDEGEEWARDWQRYDRAVRGYQARLVEASAIAPGLRVLDVGCGNGESTRSAARQANDGPVLGVDLSSQMLERARDLASAEGLTSVRFERADAQTHPFERQSFDVVISRFGTMFFGDAIAAFTNLANATVPAGRLVVVAWRGPEHNVELESAEEPLWLGTDGDDAFRFMSTGGLARGMLQGLDDADRAGALEALRATMTSHETADGVVFGSASWIISARRLAG